MLSKAKNKKKIILFSLLAVFLLILGLQPAFGGSDDPLTQFQEEQKKLQQEMDAKLKEINASKDKQRSLQTEIEQIEAQTDRIEQEYYSAQKQLTVAQTQVEEASKQLEETKATLARRQEAFQGRLRASYMQGEVNYMDVLFDSTSFTDFITRFDMLDRLLGQDKKMLEQIKTDMAKVEEEKKILEKKRDDLQALKNSKQKAMDDLNAIANQKSALVKQIEDDKELQLAAYEKMEKASQELAVKIRQLQEESGYQAEFSGVFAWPTPGYKTITDDFGPRTHPVTGAYKNHTGIDIAAKGGTNIHAADAGEVIFAGPYGVWGNAVIINHGSGMTTLYAHQSKILCAKGDIVAKGDVIGLVGSTGWSTGNHLHFEVRLNGTPVNPWNYLK